VQTRSIPPSKVAIELLVNYNRVIDQHIHQGTLQDEVGKICRDALLQAMEAAPSLGRYSVGSPEERITTDSQSVRNDAAQNWGTLLDMKCTRLTPEQTRLYSASQKFDSKLDFCSPNVMDGGNSFPQLLSLQSPAQHGSTFPGPTTGIGCPSNEQSTVPHLELSQNPNVASNFPPFCDILFDINFQESNQDLDDILFAGFDFRHADFSGSVAISQIQNEQGALPPADAGLDDYRPDSECCCEGDWLVAQLAQENKHPDAAGPHKDKNHGNRLLYNHSSLHEF
jgi:hypothetical protein